MRKTLFTFLAFTYTVTAISQIEPKTEKGKEGMYPSYIEFPAGNEPAYTKGGIYITSRSQARLLNNASFLHSEKEINGAENPRYQQTYNNIPVEGAIYILHVTKGKVSSENGKWVQTFPSDLNASPTISKEAALNAAMSDLGAKAYKWQLPEEEKFIKRESNNSTATFFPKAELVYYSGEEDIDPTNLRLAYKLDLYAADPVGRRLYFVDAVTGSVLGKRELIHTTDAAGTAVTAYSGTQPVTTDSYTTAKFRLREIGRGHGIETYNLNKGTNYSAATDFTDADNNWNNINANLDQYATDAHWGAEKTYDFYKQKFGRNSIDNAGFAIKSYIHYSTGYYNAFWDGSRMTYGDGNSSDNNKPLTALDVCGHEITHGLTSFTANLNYSDESGAMNEGFSDIFGTSIEFYARPSKHDWKMGSDFYTIRDMSNPNAFSQPDTYKGTFWYTGPDDYGGVHTNNGVLNYWFYLLSNGGSGTNDNGTTFSVKGIGIDKAAAIAYRTLTNYLIPSSQYTDARTYSIKSAQDLYGSGSAEVTQTTNAWTAVGVAAFTPPPPCPDIYESNDARITAKLIPTNTNITAKIGTSTDKDWFKFNTTAANTNIKITLSNLPADYDIRLYNSGGTLLKISQNGGTTAESIKYNTSVDGTYYIQIYGYQAANSSSCYSLNASVSHTAFFDAVDNAASITFKENEDENTNRLSIFPNPVRDVLNISLASDSRTNKNFTVFDNTGRVILRQTISVQKGSNSVRLNLPKLSKGMYYLKVDQTGLNKFEVVE